MRALLPVCAGVAVVSGIVSFNLWHELRAERLITQDLRTQLDDARIANRVSMAASRVAAVAGPTTVTTAAPGAQGVAGKTEATPARPTALPATIVDFANTERDLMKDPEYRKLRLAQLRSNMARNYPGLAEDLGLSDKEADKLYDVLAENQLNMTLDSSILAVNTQDQAEIQKMIQRQQTMQREQEASIRGLLGDGKYAQWQDYQQTRPARTRVMSMNSQLAQMGLPLSDSQSKALTTAMIAEQQRQRQDTQAMARSFANVNPNDPNSRAQMQEEMLKRNEDNNRRMIEAAAPHVNAKQLAALREQFEQQAAMSRISSRMQIERDRAQQQAQPAQ